MFRALVIATLLFFTSVSDARDLGQWENADPALRQWYSNLRQPDQPTVSCCGEADAYWADSFEVAGDKYVAIITDERPNEPLRRKPIPVGTKFLIPLHKMNRDPNPTGHGVVFIRPWDNEVLCFIAPGGV
jgi:hypothetical protein